MSDITWWHNLTCKWINSLLQVVSVCTSLHSPSPAADTAFTLTLYSVPGRSAGRRVEVELGWTLTVLVLPQSKSPLLLYWTQYSERFVTFWTAVQVTLRLGFPFFVSLDTETSVTLGGTCRDGRIAVNNKAIFMHNHTIIHAHIYIHEWLWILYQANSQCLHSFCAHSAGHYILVITAS